MALTTFPASYTSVTFVQSAYPAVGSAANVNSAIISQYIGMVQAEIDGRIRKLYSLPLTVECPILQMISTQETIYRLVAQRLLAHAGDIPDHLKGMHDSFENIMKQIVDGTITLVDASGGTIAADTTQMDVDSTTKNYTPTFHEGNFEDMIQDEDKIDDMLSDRGLT